jgi:hypothetical protein
MLLRLAAAAVVLALTASAAAADVPPPRYYFILFGGQSVPFVPRTAHTWATYAKASPTGAGPVMVESFTISWLPVNSDVRIRNVRPVTGKNYTLDETFQIMCRHHAQVSMWGPYEIDAERFDLAAGQAALLESGSVRYRVVDSFRGNPSVVHCVHAVTYADPVLKGRLQPVLRVGEPGTSKLAAMYAYSGAFLGGPCSHDWLIPALGIDRYPVIRREAGEFVPRRWL